MNDTGHTGQTGPEPRVIPMEPIRVKKKPPVNKPCPCGSGKKYKRCCMRPKPAPRPNPICIECTKDGPVPGNVCADTCEKLGQKRGPVGPDSPPSLTELRAKASLAKLVKPWR